MIGLMQNEENSLSLLHFQCRPIGADHVRGVIAWVRLAGAFSTSNALENDTRTSVVVPLR